MSIKIMSQVWEQSEQKGSHRLVLLAIADNANDSGVCWPAIDTLAKKCRLTDRYVRGIIADLIKDGELIVEERPGTSNLYHVGMNYSSGVGMNYSSGGYEQESIPTPEQESRGGMNYSSGKPSINRNNEPSTNIMASIEEIVNYFTDKTGIKAPPPNHTRKWQDDWITPVNELLTLCGDNVESTKRLIDKTLAHMDAAGLSYSRPKSLENVAPRLNRQGNYHKLWGEVEKEIKANGRRSGRKWNGSIEPILKKVGGYNRLCNLALQDAERLFESAYKDTT